MGRAWILAALLLTAFLPMPMASAQAEATPGALFATGQVIYQNAGCNGATSYVMSASAPPAGKANLGLSPIGVSCDIYFRYTTEVATVLSGDFKVYALVGCDGAGPAIQFNYDFYVGATRLAGAATQVSWTCTPGTTFPYQQLFTAADVPVPAGTQLALRLLVFALTPPPASPVPVWYVKVGGAAPTGVSGVGLPGTVYPILPAAALSLDAGAAAAEATPGGNATFGLTVTNNGTGAGTFAFAAEGLPTGYAASFDPPNGTVEPGAAATSTLTVSVPADATTGATTFVLNLTKDDGTSEFANLTLTVLETEPVTSTDPTGGTDGPTDGTETTGGNETGNGTAAAGGDAGVPGPGAVLVSLGLMAAAVLVRRRRA